MTMSEREVELLRRMSPAEKLGVMDSLIRQAYELKAAALRSMRPDWTEEEIEAETRRSVGGEAP